MGNKLVSESLEEFQELTEKLKGKQYKIDVDKNKKITPNDFTILRGEKKPPKKKINEQFSEETFFDYFVNQLSGEKEKNPLFRIFIKNRQYFDAVDRFLEDYKARIEDIDPNFSMTDGIPDWEKMNPIKAEKEIKEFFKSFFLDSEIYLENLEKDVDISSYYPG